MTSETFGFYVGIVYIQKGVELLVIEFPSGEGTGWSAVALAILFALTVYFCQRAGTLPFGPFWFRKILVDYSFALAAIWWSGFTHIPGYIKGGNFRYLPTSPSWFPSQA